MKMTIFLFFFIFLFGIVLISSTSKGDIMGLLNSSGVVHYTLTHFNDSATTKTISFTSSGTDSNTFISIPKNASILSSYLNISGVLYTTTEQTSYPYEDANLNEATPDTNAGLGLNLIINAGIKMSHPFFLSQGKIDRNIK